MFHMLCRIKLFSNMHRTEIVVVMGRGLTMGVSSTKLDRQQQNFSGHILLSWSVVLQGRPVRQNGGGIVFLAYRLRDTLHSGSLICLSILCIINIVYAERGNSLVYNDDADNVEIAE